MFEKVKSKIESKRKSPYFLWRLSVIIKDFLWFVSFASKTVFGGVKFIYIFLYAGFENFIKTFKKFVIKIVWGNKAEIVGKKSFKAKLFRFLSDGDGIIEFPRRNLSVIVAGVLGLSESGEFYAAEGYFLEYFPKSGEVAIDGGACNGLITVILSLIVGKSGRVIAFEPDPENFENLKSNVKIYGLKNVAIINKGLFSRGDRMNFYGKGFLGSFFNVNNQKPCVIAEIARLDDEIERIGIKKVNFVKMDIEGSEIEAVRGAEKTLKNSDANLSIASYHILNGKPTHAELEKELKRLGYESKTGFEKHLTTYAKKIRPVAKQN